MDQQKKLAGYMAMLTWRDASAMEEELPAGQIKS